MYIYLVCVAGHIASMDAPNCFRCVLETGGSYSFPQSFFSSS